jgi:alginate O-acetyltransferase complex protein AlgI
MSLISLEYAVFVAVAALLFQMSARPKRPAMLCVISLLFCALNSVGAAVALLIATAMTFLFGRWIEKASDGRQRRILLGMAVAILLGHLALVKVVPHLSRMDQGEWLPQMLATFGTSYYTLKLIGYLIDVFWGRYRAWPDPVYFGAFATFFPLLPAGPIQRANEFSLPQDDGSIAEQMVYGLRRVLFGLVKK